MESVHPTTKDDYEDMSLENVEKKYVNFTRSQLILEIRILKMENKFLRADVSRLTESLLVYKEMPSVDEQIKCILKNLKTASELSESLISNAQKTSSRENADSQKNKRKLDNPSYEDPKRRANTVIVKEENQELESDQSEMFTEYDSSGYLEQTYDNSDKVDETETLNSENESRRIGNEERSNLSSSFTIFDKDQDSMNFNENHVENYVPLSNNIEPILNIDVEANSLAEFNQDKFYKQENADYPAELRNWDDDDENKIIFKEGLENILKESIEGKHILKVTGIFQEVHRRNLTKIVLNYLNRNYAINQKIPIPVFEQAAEEIEKTFSNECRLTYFVPPKKKTKTTPSVGASGKLWAKYYNLKRATKTLQNEIMLRGENQRDETVEKVTIGVDEKTAFQYLQRNIEISPKLIDCWKKSYSMRKEYLDKQEKIEYFNEIPSLKTEKGFRLLLEDFDRQYSNKSYKLYEKWSVISKKIVHLCKLKNLIPKDSAELTDLVVLTLLPQLFQPVTTRKVNSITRIKRNNAQETFFFIISDSTSLQTALEERKKESSQSLDSFQPFMTAIVVNSVVKSIYVVLNNILYKTDSVIHCLDTCFKLFFALNSQYPLECKPVWMFIQNYIYEIETKFDKIYTTVRCAISDMEKVSVE